MSIHLKVYFHKDIKEKTYSNIEEVKSRGAYTIVISNEETTLGDCKIITPKASEFFQPILVVPILQLIAYEVAKLRGKEESEILG